MSDCGVTAAGGSGSLSLQWEWREAVALWKNLTSLLSEKLSGDTALYDCDQKNGSQTNWWTVSPVTFKDPPYFCYNAAYLYLHQHALPHLNKQTEKVWEQRRFGAEWESERPSSSSLTWGLGRGGWAGPPDRAHDSPPAAGGRFGGRWGGGPASVHRVLILEVLICNDRRDRKR